MSKEIVPFEHVHVTVVSRLEPTAGQEPPGALRNIFKAKLVGVLVLKNNEDVRLTGPTMTKRMNRGPCNNRGKPLGSMVERVPFSSVQSVGRVICMGRE